MPITLEDLLKVCDLVNPTVNVATCLAENRTRRHRQRCAIQMLNLIFQLTYFTVIQTIINANSLFSGVGSYPLEGGYI